MADDEWKRKPTSREPNAMTVESKRDSRTNETAPKCKAAQASRDKKRQTHKSDSSLR